MLNIRNWPERPADADLFSHVDSYMSRSFSSHFYQIEKTPLNVCLSWLGAEGRHTSAQRRASAYICLMYINEFVLRKKITHLRPCILLSNFSVFGRLHTIFIVHAK